MFAFWNSAKRKIIPFQRRDHYKINNVFWQNVTETKVCTFAFCLVLQRVAICFLKKVVYTSLQYVIMV